ncbi:potassium channel family protein [Sphingomonas sp. NFR15]|uniref:potassium channel family protein n=1 Tax=Sphingomonas sp. NFR15 TaxID=1566282 RepID=UPI000886E711|nr:potassium channel family protein [Sphingomonas sp. NFR15]SDA17194.1 Ion channel [Sphingomonas sp. NFR15]
MTASPPAPAPPPHADRALSALLIVQAVSLFVAIPLSAQHPGWHVVLDAGHLVFAAVSVAVLAHNRVTRGLLLAALAGLAVGPIIGEQAVASRGLAAVTMHESIALTAFVFNGLVTALIARHVFGPGRVTSHRLQGAVLVYLNVAQLFAIAYGVIETRAPGALVMSDGLKFANPAGARTAALTYFSLVTITTTGFGDIVPMHPIARSLVNLESVFGHLFPATLLARLVALHLAHADDSAGKRDAGV